MTIRTVEIAGGGLAGMAAAVAFAQRGWTVRVWEQAPALREIGAGLYVWENGLRVLEALSVLDLLEASSHRVRAFEVFDERLNVVERFSYSHLPGERLVTMLRPALHRALAETASRLGVQVETGQKVLAAEQGGVLVLDSGDRHEADLIVAADGATSRVRDSLGVLQKKRTLSDGATRLLVPRTEEEREDPKWHVCREYWGGTRRFLYTPCSPESVYLAFAGRIDDDRAKAVPVDVESWSETFPHLSELIHRVTPETSARWDDFSLVRLKRWSSGRVAVIGDAAHAQPPNLGQGACLAMSNALALAATVHDASDMTAALATWEARERPIVEHTQRWTYLWGLASVTWPKSLQNQRSQVVSWLSKRRWIGRQLTKTSSHIPTGAV
jgi:2-polyprenyl-6-methoxyphenol hydroxylase-like FAD-dependent oxidoreductase